VAEEAALLRHTHQTLAGDKDVPLPAESLHARPEAFYEAASHGVLFAKLVLKAAPCALDTRALNLCEHAGAQHGGGHLARPLTEAARLQNITLALHAAASIGAVVVGLTPRQLRDAPEHRGAALELLWQLTRAKFRARLVPVLRKMGESGGGGGGGAAAAAAAAAEAEAALQAAPQAALLLGEKTRQQRMGKQTSFERMRRMGKQTSFERMRRRQQRLPEPPASISTTFDSPASPPAPAVPASTSPAAAATPAPAAAGCPGARRVRKLSREGRGFVRAGGVASSEETKMVRWINIHLEMHAAALYQPGAAAAVAVAAEAAPAEPVAADAAAAAAAEVVLVAARGFPVAVAELGAGLADGRALAVVLHRIAPAGSCDLRWLSPLLELADAEGGAEARAAALLEAAARLNVTFELAPADLVAGRWRLLYCFVASLMTSFWAARGGGGAADDAPTDDAEAREELALRSWMTSLGLGRQLSSVSEDCRDGVLLLKVCERLRPGCVQWGKVRTRHTSVYARAEVCNYALEVARSLGMTAVGISGQDIAAGAAKLTLGVVWQLMRADVLRFLSTVQVEESDIRAWANRKAHQQGISVQLTSFRDPALADGVFILHCLHAVAPECVDPQLILPCMGGSEEEARRNAEYAISCAHKACRDAPACALHYLVLGSYLLPTSTRGGLRLHVLRVAYYFLVPP